MTLLTRYSSLLLLLRLSFRAFSSIIIIYTILFFPQIMSSTSFTTLAPELVIQVFKSTDDFRTVSSQQNMKQILKDLDIEPTLLSLMQSFLELSNSPTGRKSYSMLRREPSGLSERPRAPATPVIRQMRVKRPYSERQYLLSSKTVLVELQRFQEDECALSDEGESCFKRA